MRFSLQPLSSHAAIIILIALGLLGCGDKIKAPGAVGNLLPEVRVTAGPVDTTDPYHYAVTVNWVGYDADGRVDHFMYTIDPHLLPAGADTEWVVTRENEKFLLFSATELDTTPTGDLIGTDFHVFLIKAVDDRGAEGPFVERAFFSFTEAPSVRIINPPTNSFYAFVTPSVRISWRGTDPDGVFTQEPVKYKYILLSSSSEFPAALAFQKPDSLRRYYLNHPDGPWAGWDSTSADTTDHQFTNLTPNADYLFAVIAFDEAGAYSPVFSIATNMLRMRIGFAQTLGPVITMFNEFFNYTYPSGGYCPCPSATIPVEVPANQEITIVWFAQPPPGSDIRHYRWAVDIEDVADDTPRRDDKDFKHWSTPGANVIFAIIGPWRGGEKHLFYVEAQDNNGLESLGIVEFTAVEATFDKPLLIVEDTRVGADNLQRGATCVDRPRGVWPNRAELDTFLFAVGGQPWKCYPEGTTSLPGLFAGYSFDTVGTRIGKLDLTVRLSLLSQYQHVIWLTDAIGASLRNPGIDGVDPQTAFRFMNSPGRSNTLATYLRQGGKVWLSGGGAGLAATDPFDDPGNNLFNGRTYSAGGSRPELRPGRFMYDWVRWRTEFSSVLLTNAVIEKSLGRYQFTETDRYAALPPVLNLKTASTDPLATEAPTRASSEFHRRSITFEFLDRVGFEEPNRIIENLSSDPDSSNEQSTLDTLYRVRVLVGELTDPTQPPYPGPDPAVNQQPFFIPMTNYRGRNLTKSEILFTGFPIWSLRREHGQAMVDFVLQNLWNMPKNPMARAGRLASSSASLQSAHGRLDRPNTRAPALDMPFKDGKRTRFPRGRN
jgi:hypothetical protein